MKRRWVVISAIVGMLVLGLGGGAVFAQDPDGEDGSPLKSFASRVAAILGLEDAQVQEALQQAGREMQDEALDLKLTRMVEAGRLTQAQADEYRDWYRDRPDSGPQGFRGFHGGRRHGRGGFGISGLGHMKRFQPDAAPPVQDGSVS